IAPENAPDAAPASTPARPARTIPVAPADSPPAASRIRRAVTTADRAIRLPTERSTPPVTITIVIPIAITAITAIWLATFKRFSALRKFGQRYGSGLSTFAPASD